MRSSKTILAGSALVAETSGIAKNQTSPSGSENQTFLEQYDEVLNRHILYVFRKTNEEHDRPHDHRALRVIDGEVVKLRLDTLNGQADGIKVFLEKESVPMYIWFAPDTMASQIIFKTVCGERRKRLRFKLEQVSHDFLLNLISKVFIPANKLVLS